ncbi:hypothetical protein B0H13DRAFT_1880554 [Mycena leptocephala]|nr:hypothetical protein B0H13DRAFT_1880554 [Mycena leptocephala]
MSTSMSLGQELVTLLAAINNLPASSKSGHRDAKYLTPGLTKGNDPKPVFPGREHVFQKLASQPADKFTKLMAYGHGKHGLILAQAWAAQYATVVTSMERDLVQLRVQSLLKLITNCIAVIGPNTNNDNLSSATDDKADKSADGDDEMIFYSAKARSTIQLQRNHLSFLFRKFPSILAARLHRELEIQGKTEFVFSLVVKASYLSPSNWIPDREY